MIGGYFIQKGIAKLKKNWLGKFSSHSLGLQNIIVYDEAFPDRNLYTLGAELASQQFK